MIKMVLILIIPKRKFDLLDCWIIFASVIIYFIRQPILQIKLINLNHELLIFIGYFIFDDLINPRDLETSKVISKQMVLLHDIFDYRPFEVGVK